jgi:hypothetical protein
VKLSLDKLQIKLTLAVDGDEWLHSKSRHIIPGKELPIDTAQEAGWASELAWIW